MGYLGGSTRFVQVTSQDFEIHLLAILLPCANFKPTIGGVLEMRKHQDYKVISYARIPASTFPVWEFGRGLLGLELLAFCAGSPVERQASLKDKLQEG